MHHGFVSADEAVVFDVVDDQGGVVQGFDEDGDGVDCWLVGGEVRRGGGAEVGDGVGWVRAGVLRRMRMRLPPREKRSRSGAERMGES